MNWLNQGTNFMLQNLPFVLLILCGLILACFIVFIVINVRLSGITKKYRQLTNGMDGKNIEQILYAHIEEVHAARGEMSDLRNLCAQLQETGKNCFQKMGVVRFNAFEQTGGDLSFAIALLDQHNNGVIISSIYGREESRVYAKPVKNGESNYYLSDEEQVALSKAQGVQ